MPSTAISTALRWNPGMSAPGISNVVTTSVIARIVWLGASSSAALSRLR